MIDKATNISAKVHELQEAMDKSAHEFQELEVHVETINKSILDKTAQAKQKEEEIHRKMIEIEKLKQEKQQLERDVAHHRQELEKAKNEMTAKKRENDRHHMEYQRFHTEYEAAEREAKLRSGNNKRTAA